MVTLPGQHVGRPGDQRHLSGLDDVEPDLRRPGVGRPLGDRRSRPQAEVLGGLPGQSLHGSAQVEHVGGELVEHVAEPDLLVEARRPAVFVAVVIGAQAGGVDAGCPPTCEPEGQPVRGFYEVRRPIVGLRLVLLQPEGFRRVPLGGDRTAAVVLPAGMLGFGDAQRLVRGPDVHPHDGRSQHPIRAIHRHHGAGRAVV